ncbi:MAG TPA: hypothetical protein VE993_11045, partial [Stellaceae bacterium]|nr:hypothetical protein [Stellaceae bacterium]
MAIFSYRMGDRVSRGAGQSAVRVAAYQAREKLRDERTGYTYNSLPRERVAPRLSDIAEAEPQRSGIAAAAAYIDSAAGYDAGRKA